MLKHRVPLASRWGGIFLPKIFFTMDFCLCGAILNLKAFCFGAIPDIMIELTACVGLPGLYLLQGPSKGPHNLTSTGLICRKSGTEEYSGGESFRNEPDRKKGEDSFRKCRKVGGWCKF